MKTKNYKIISFYKFAQSIGATQDNISKEIDINDLLLKSYLFLSKDIILTKREEQEFKIFKDRYNDFLEYCVQNNLVKKNYFQKVKFLNITTVPDMSKIKIPDIKQELKEMNIDLDKLANIFGKFNL